MSLCQLLIWPILTWAILMKQRTKVLNNKIWSIKLGLMALRWIHEISNLYTQMSYMNLTQKCLCHYSSHRILYVTGIIKCLLSQVMVTLTIQCWTIQSKSIKVNGKFSLFHGPPQQWTDYTHTAVSLKVLYFPECWEGNKPKYNKPQKLCKQTVSKGQCINLRKGNAESTQ